MEEMELVAVVAQRIWFRRNRYISEGTMTPPNCLLKGAKETVEEYHHIQEQALPLEQVRVPLGPIHWSTPPT
jgi:hypothetical protein